mgnify:CR=1 FL=1
MYRCVTPKTSLKYELVPTLIPVVNVLKPANVCVSVVTTPLWVPLAFSTDITLLVFINGELNTNLIISILNSLNYNIEILKQGDFDYQPLIFATPII